MAALKDQVDAALARRLAAELEAAWPAFPGRRFTSGLAEALEPLELLARVDELGDRLARALPAEFPAAAAVVWRCLDSPSFSGWMTVACGKFVARQGIDDPELALPLLAGLTPRWSSEWALRPFIVRHPRSRTTSCAAGPPTTTSTSVKAPRVFKLARRRLEPGRPVSIRREHRFDHFSIRRIHAGRHAIDIQVNGRVLGSAAVEITPSRRG